MTVTENATAADPDRTAADVAWELDPLLEDDTVDGLLDRADALGAEIEAYRGRIATLPAGELAELMAVAARYEELVGRAGSHVSLEFAVDSLSPERGAAMARFQERATQMATKLVFVELEWAGADDDHVEAVLADERLAFCVHHLRNLRRYRQHLLSEPEEKLLTEKSVSGGSAWVRLFSELTSAIEITLPPGLAGSSSDGPEVVGLEQGLSLIQHPDREVRRIAADAVTTGLAPGLRTRAYVFNTLLLDKSVDDRLRSYPSWVSSRNLSNEASDESVQALVDAVIARYDIPQRWYSLKARVLGVDRLADYDRNASVADDETEVGWSEAKGIVLEAYNSFSPEMASIARRFFDERWIDAPVRPGKRPGAFCAYTVPSHHPYVFLNWTSRARDVATLAHELGHGLHAYLSREQGVFHFATPLTLAETASVFGETVTNNAVLATLDDPGARFALLASTLEDSIATVFRQVAMNRFEDAVHTSRRDEGELSVDRFGELWVDTQTAMLGDSVELTPGYRTWWSYIPHFIGTPGYVYAYAYGQLLALSVYARYEAAGADFVPDYLRLLSAGGSMAPGELGRIVGCDLDDPGFWDAGLAIVAGQLDRAEEAAAPQDALPTDLVPLPSLVDLRAAAARLAGVAVRTPLVRFDDVLSVKPESLQPVGSFKLRGAYNAIAALPDDVRARGVVAHSSGNHAQAVAWAAARLGVPAVVVMPDDAPPVKREATARWQPEIVVVGPSSDERAERCAALAAERGLTIVAPYDAPLVVAGQGTIGLEIVDDAPAVDLVLVPVSGGGLLAGVAAAVRALRPACRIVAVEPALADDAWQSFQRGERVGITAADAARTVADGLRVQRLGDHGWAALRTLVTDVVRVSEEEILATVDALARVSRVLAEPSGAVATAAWIHHRGLLPPTSCAVAVVSGGNADHRLVQAAPA